MASNVLGMTGHHGYTARLSTVCLLVNVALSVALIHPLQLMGVALGALLSTMVVGDFIVVREACRVYDLSYRDYVYHALVPAALPGALQFAVTYGLKTWMPPTNLAAIALQGLPGVVLFGAAFWLFSVTPSEKRLLSEKLGITAQMGRHRAPRPCST
jgi:O-antigen/teichoic acid export membrane protein